MAQPLFRTALGDDWETLPKEVQELHKISEKAEFVGFADVERGQRPFGWLIAFLFRLPDNGIDVPVKVIKLRTGDGEVWQRKFGSRAFRSHLRLLGPPPKVTERLGPFTFELGLRVRKNAIRVPVKRGWFLGIPLPKRLLPTSRSREYAAGGSFRFDVALYAPFDRSLIVRYRGSLSRRLEEPTEETAQNRSTTPQPSQHHKVSRS